MLEAIWGWSQKILGGPYREVPVRLPQGAPPIQKKIIAISSKFAASDDVL